MSGRWQLESGRILALGISKRSETSRLFMCKDFQWITRGGNREVVRVGVWLIRKSMFNEEPLELRDR